MSGSQFFFVKITTKFPWKRLNLMYINPKLYAFLQVSSNMEVVGVTALALGLIAVGSCNNDVTTTLLQTLMEKSELELKDAFAKYLPLGIGLCYLGKQVFQHYLSHS